MKEILLISENFIKAQTNLSDNINGKILLSAMREAQEINLKSILGSSLLNAIKKAGEEGITLPKNAKYNDLLPYIQYYLAYQVLSNIIMITAVKIDNLGVNRMSDDNVEPIEFTDLYSLKGYYQSKADWYAKELQNYLSENYSLYPELNDNDCYSIKSNLYSAATSGLWLGGVRGSKYRNAISQYNNCGSSMGSPAPECKKQDITIDASNLTIIYTADEGYTCLGEVTAEGYDVDAQYDKLKNI